MKSQKIMLELFSGSKTVSNFFESNGYQSISVDTNPQLCPSMCTNILEIDVSTLPSNISFIWASPDCTYFSRAGNPAHWFRFYVKKRVYEYHPLSESAQTALLLLSKTIEIINFYVGVPFVIENPIGRIQHLDQLKRLGHYRYYVNYADFGFNYSKETYLFSNFLLPFSQKKITVNAPGLYTVNSKFQRSMVPPALIAEIFRYLPNSEQQF